MSTIQISTRLFPLVLATCGACQAADALRPVVAPVSPALTGPVPTGPSSVKPSTQQGASTSALGVRWRFVSGTSWFDVAMRQGVSLSGPVSHSAEDAVLELAKAAKVNVFMDSTSIPETAASTVASGSVEKPTVKQGTLRALLDEVARTKKLTWMRLDVPAFENQPVPEAGGVSPRLPAGPVVPLEKTAANGLPAGGTVAKPAAILMWSQPNILALGKRIAQGEDIQRVGKTAFYPAKNGQATSTAVSVAPEREVVLAQVRTALDDVLAARPPLKNGDRQFLPLADLPRATQEQVLQLVQSEVSEPLYAASWKAWMTDNFWQQARLRLQTRDVPAPGAVPGPNAPMKTLEFLAVVGAVPIAGQNGFSMMSLDIRTMPKP